MLEKQLSIGLKITLIITSIILIHSISNFAGSLGLISDVFILLGLIQSIRFLTDNDVREELINSFNKFISINDINTTIKLLLKFVKDSAEEINEEVIEEISSAHNHNLKNSRSKNLAISKADIENGEVSDDALLDWNLLK
jgi:hypothetical protein